MFFVKPESQAVSRFSKGTPVLFTQKPKLIFTSQKLTAPGPHRLQLLSGSASKVVWWSFVKKGDIGP